MNIKEKVESSFANADEVNEYIDNTIKTFAEKLDKSVSFLTGEQHDKLVNGLYEEIKKWSKKVPLYIECVQEWYEDPDEKTGWSDGGWECVDDNEYECIIEFERFYELYVVVDTDKHCHPTHSIWKLKSEYQ